MSGIKYALYLAFYYFYQVISYGILIYCIGSWFIRPDTKLGYYYRKFGYFIDPLFRPARYLLDKIGAYRLGIDFSPWLTCILLNWIFRLILNILF